MDMSKVMVNLHRGKYEALTDFAADVRLIFANWEKYNNDAKSEVRDKLGMKKCFLQKRVEYINS